MVERYISEFDFNIELVHARDGEEGIKLAHAQHPDLIILDINLPKIHGLQVYKEIKKDRDAKSIPIVALSAAAMPEEVEKAKDVGFEEFLSKPIDIKVLYKTIKKYLPDINQP